MTDFDVTVASGETEPDSSASDAMLMVDNSSIEDMNLELAGSDNNTSSTDDEESENQEESQESAGPWYGNFLADGGESINIFEKVFSSEATDYFEEYTYKVSDNENFIQIPELHEEDILIGIEIV